MSTEAPATETPGTLNSETPGTLNPETHRDKQLLVETLNTTDNFFFFTELFIQLRHISILQCVAQTQTKLQTQM